MAVFYIIEQKKKREQAKRNEAMIRFINSMESMDKNYVSTSTWGVTNRYPASPQLTKEEVWDMCVNLYESKIIDSKRFRQVSKLLDKNRIKEAYDLLNALD